MTKTCKYCGETKDISLFDKDRWVVGGYRSRCKECRNEYRREFWKTHTRIRYNKEREKEYNKEYREKHKEELSIKNAKWRKENLSKIRANKANRRALIKNSGSITIVEVNKLIEDSNNICFWCNENIPEGKMQLDHVYPLSKGGGHTISNLVVSCATCNRKKAAKNPEAWLEEILNIRAYNK